MSGRPRLPDCEHRHRTTDPEIFFCSHTGVQSPGHRVPRQICEVCRTCEQPCETPRPVPLSMSAGGGATPESLRQQVPQLVTIGITAFRRPESLVRMVRSIRAAWPDVEIIVADNGDQHAELNDPCLQYHVLPFDCGVSAARNAIADLCQTRYLLIAEDDFEFTDQTKLESFVDVLEHDHEVGCVGGSLVLHGDRCDFAGDFEVFRGELTVRQPRRLMQRTPNGTHFHVVDLVFNFALFRREMLAEHLWDEQLKICEHVEYFYSVWQAARWRVAVCRSVSCLHYQERSSDYNEYRFRQEMKLMTRQWLQTHHLSRVRISPARTLESDLAGPPNIVVFGVGHSGTSVVTKMIRSLGWNTALHEQDLDVEFFEHISVRQLNEATIRGGRLDLDAAREELEKLPTPWVLKDPRFVVTMHQWLEAFSDHQPLLLWLVREPESVKASYRRRQVAPQGEPITRGRTIDEALQDTADIYYAWPWQKLRLKFEDIATAAASFDLARSGIRRREQTTLSPTPAQQSGRTTTGVEE